MSKRGREDQGQHEEQDQEIAVVDLARRFSFSAAHRLDSPHLSPEENKRVFGKCNNPNGHGHNYEVLVGFRGRIDARTGMVVNLVDVKEELQKVEAQVDHKNLDKDVPWFAKRVSTTENVAVFIWEQLAAGPLQHMLHKVEVWETENNKFIYKGKKQKK